MNTPEVGYGYEQAERPIPGTEIRIVGGWYPLTVPLHPEFNAAQIKGIRRKVDLGGPEWELVDQSEKLSTGMEITSDGANWIPAVSSFLVWINPGKISKLLHNGSPVIAVRRRKAKVVTPEQYNWLSVDSGVPIPVGEVLDVVTEHNQMTRAAYTRDGKWEWVTTNFELEAKVLYWFRMPPHPTVEKVDPCEKAWSDYYRNSTRSNEHYAWRCAWSACEAHYKVGDQSKGAK